MWWCRAALLSLGLMACGYTPVYGPGGGDVLRGAITAREPKSPDEFRFVEAFEENLGLPNAPRYGLNYTISISESGQAITANNATTRYTVNGTINYQVLEGETVVTSGSVTSFTGYSATDSTVAPIAAERDARERLLKILTDQIVTRLLTTPELR